MHPMRTAACGGITPNWLGTARVVSTPWAKLECPLQYGRCTTFQSGHWWDPSLGRMIWRTRCCPCSMPPLSTSLTDPKEQQAVTIWRQSRRRTDARTGLSTTHGTALGSPTPDFSSGFTPEAFAYPKAATRQWQTHGGRDV